LDRTIEFLSEIKKYNVPILLGIFPMKSYGMAKIKKYNVPILLGIFPMKSYGMAKGFDTFVPGVDVPKDILAKWKNIKTEFKDDTLYFRAQEKGFASWRALHGSSLSPNFS